LLSIFDAMALARAERRPGERRLLTLLALSDIGNPASRNPRGAMIKPDIEALGVQERVLLFCLASGTDWKEAGITLETVAGMAGKGLLFAQNAPLLMSRGGHLALTDAGRAAFRALLRDV
jgi:hypothetical protein